MFKDRKEAGEKLAKALEKYKNKKVIVLGIPRGGVEVAYYVAKHLNAKLSIIVSRKLPYPNNPEAGFGAIAEDGNIFIFEDAKYSLPKEMIDRIIGEQKEEIKRRIKVLRKNKPLPEIKNKMVIIVDDGIAMGSTLMAAIMLCRKKKAKKIIIASPVSGKEFPKSIKNDVDEIIILEQPNFFQAVAQVYRNWHDVSDEEVLKIMDKWEKEHQEISIT